MKTCPGCQTLKPLSEFGRNQSKPEGRQARCKPCMVLSSRASRAKKLDEYRAKQREGWQRRRAAKGPDWSAEHGTRAPDGPCDICGDVGRRGVDHDHKCCPGQRSCEKCRRGFLCQRCNHMLGHALDNPARLRAAATYLER